MKKKQIIQHEGHWHCESCGAYWYTKEYKHKCQPKTPALSQGFWYNQREIFFKTYSTNSGRLLRTLPLITLSRLSLVGGMSYFAYVFGNSASKRTISLSRIFFSLGVSIYSNSSFNNSASSVISFTKKKISAFLSTSIFKTESTNCYHISSPPFFIKVLVEEINSSIYIISWVLKTNVYARFLLNPYVKSLKKTCQVHFFRVEATLNYFSHAFCSILLISTPKIKSYQTISL